MKTSKSHRRGDHVMERFHSAKHSFFGSWRCQPCAGDFLSPVSRAQKHRGQKKDRQDPNSDPDFVKSNKKVSEKDDRRDPNFDPEFAKSSQTAPAREDSNGPANATKSSQPPAAKPYRKGRSLRSFMNDSQQPKAREDHLLLENQSWRKEEDAEGNRKGERGKINEQLQPTHLEDGNELKPQDKNGKSLEGKDAKVPSPTNRPETESLKHSEPVNNTTTSDEAAAKETARKGSQSHQCQVNGEVQPKSQEDRHELEFPNEDKENLEEKDAVPSHTGLENSESLNQAEQVSSSSVSGESLKHSEPVNNRTISDEAAAKETPIKNSQLHQGQVNGEVQPKSQEDRHELEFPNEDKENLEEKDAVPSHTGLEKSESLNQAEQVSSSSVSGESLKHSEPVNNRTISDEAAAKETARKGSQSHQCQVNGEVQPKSQEDRHELEFPNEDKENLEEKDAVPSHTGLENSESLNQAEQVSSSSVSGESLKHSEPVNNRTISDEAAAKETPINSQLHQGQVNGEVQPKSQEDRHELEFPNEDKENLEEKDAVPSHTGLEKSESLNQAEQVSSSSVSGESLKHSEPVNNRTISDEAAAKETARKGSQSHQCQVNGEVQPKSQEDRHELEFPNEDKENLEEKDAVPSHTGLENSESLNQAEQVSSSSVSGESLKHSEPVNNRTISDEAAAKETPRKNSQLHQGQVNGEVQPKSQEDRHELEFPNEDKENLEEKDAVPSHTGLEKSESLNQAEQVSSSSVSGESLKHSEPVNNRTISDEAAAKETARKGSQSHQCQVNGEVQPKSQEDRHELEFPNEDKENLEEKDAVPSHTGLENSESLNQAEQMSSSSVSGESLKHSEPVNNRTISDEAAAKETARKNSQLHQGQVNGEVQPKSQEDRHELEFPNEDKENLEEKDAVPSHTGLEKSESLNQADQVSSSSVSGESLKHSEPVNNRTISDEAAAKETARKGSQSHQCQVNGEVQPKSQEDRHELEFPNEDKENLEEKDAVPSHTGLENSESLNQAEQVSSSSVSGESLKHSEPVNNRTISDEAAAKETPRKNSQLHQGQVNGEVQPKSQEDRHELEFPNEDKENLEEKDAVPSHTGLENSESLNQAEQVSSSSVSGESLKHSEPVNNRTISDEAAAKETARKNSQLHQGQVNGEVQPKSQEDRHELEFPNEDKENLEEKDAVPSHTGLEKSESLNQAEQVSSSSVSGESWKHSEPVNNRTISDEAAAKETPRKNSQLHQGQVNGEVQPKSQEDRHELEFPNEDKENLEEKDAVPSHTGLEKSESLNQAEQVSSSSVLGEVVGKENEQSEDSPSQRADMNGQLPPTSQPDEQELKALEENVGNLEGTYGVPSHHSVSKILPITEFLEHLEPDSKTTASDESAQDGDTVPPDGSQGQFSQSSKMGPRSVMQCAPEKDSQHEKRLQSESLEELDPGHKTIAAHVGAQGEVEHHLDSPPPEYLKQFSQTSEGEEGGKSIDMLIQYWEEMRKHHPEDVVHEGKFQHTGSQILECSKEFSKADSNRLSRCGSRSRAEHLESPRNQGNLSKQSSDIDAAGQKTNIPHSESYEGPKEAEGEKVTPAISTGLHQTQNEIFGASGFRDAEQERDFPKLNGDGLHTAGDEKPGASEDANPTHPLNGVTDQDSQNEREASRSLKDMPKGNSARPSSASSEDEFQHQEGTSSGETKYAMNSDRHQVMEGKKKQDGLHGKQTQHADQEDHYSRNTGLLPLNLEDLNRAEGTKPPNAGSEHQFEHQDDFYGDHGKGEKMQDSFIEKQIHGATSDPEECFPNSDNLEEFLTRNGYKKGASDSAHGNGSRISSSHDQGKAGSTCLWDRVSAHDIGEDKTGHVYRDHSQHIGHSHRTGLPDRTHRGEEAARAEETSAWKLGFLSVPHIVAVGALTALSVLGKAAN